MCHNFFFFSNGFVACYIKLNSTFFLAKKVLITGGKSNGIGFGDYEKTSEVLNLETGEHCNDWIDFPVDPGLIGATGGFLGKVSVICGGGPSDLHHDECYYMNATSTEFLLKMNTKRHSINFRTVSSYHLLFALMNWFPFLAKQHAQYP